jgi:hypothetical protein
MLFQEGLCVRRFLNCSLLLVFLASALAAANRQTPNVRGAKMLDCYGLPCVEITVASGEHLRLLIDTAT